ncbi:hypothetical protein ACP4OV_001083 [Aristida adscensionis]
MGLNNAAWGVAELMNWKRILEEPETHRRSQKSEQFCVYPVPNGQVLPLLLAFFSDQLEAKTQHPSFSRRTDSGCNSIHTSLSSSSW